MSLPLPLRNLFHLGYVVIDLERAMAGMRDRFGVADWKIVPLPEGSPAKAIGFAYAQGTMMELVELDLRVELMAIHRGFVPASPAEARLNHVAYLLDGEDELFAQKRRFEDAGIATVWHDAFGDIFSHYYYADTTALLGHFTEFVTLGPAGRDFLAAVPRN
jgi:hypothetical protein